MKRRRMHGTVRLLASVGLVLALVQRGVAEDAPPAESTVAPPPSASLPPNAAPPVAPPAPAEKIGPGAPRAAAKKPASPAKAKTASAAGIHVSPLTPLAKTVNVHPKVLEECRLQSLLPQSIAERNSDVVLSDGAGGMKLELKIVDIHAPNGGWFSGPKWITVEGRLLQGKTVKGSFLAKETSMASATACGMLNKVILVLADDIAQWLHSPAKDSRLGSAR